MCASGEDASRRALAGQFAEPQRFAADGGTREPGARRGAPSALAAQRLGLTGGVGSLIVAVTSASVMRLSFSHRCAGNSIWARRCPPEIYGRFTEGFDTTALREARDLLDELCNGPAVSRPSPRRWRLV